MRSFEESKVAGPGLAGSWRAAQPLVGIAAGMLAAVMTVPALAQDGAAKGRAEVPGPSEEPRAPAGAELALGTTSVSGNRELPRVMVVVPWKTAAPATLGGRPIVSLVEEALTPVDPEVFRRELEYYGLLHGKQDDGAAKVAVTANNLTED